MDSEIRDLRCQHCGAELTGQAVDGHCANCLLKLALEPPLFTTNRAPLNDLTHLLHSIEQGDGKAAAELLPLVYAELRIGTVINSEKRFSLVSPGRSEARLNGVARADADGRSGTP